jgi:hypothetical protein
MVTHRGLHTGRLTSLLARAVTAALAATLITCCGGAVAGDRERESAQERAFRVEWATAACDVSASCCELFGRVPLGDCREKVLRFSEPGLIDQGARVLFDEEEGATCVASVRSQANPCFENEPAQSCDRLWLGLQKAGEPCEFDEECEPGTQCVYSFAARNSRCLRPIDVALHDACGPNDDGSTYHRCPAGAGCTNGECSRSEVSAPRCSTPSSCVVPPGGACGVDSDCVHGMCYAGRCADGNPVALCATP